MSHPQEEQPAPADDASYSYNCVDRSLLLPYYKKYYVALYYKLIPARVPANLITLGSAAFMWAMAPLSIFRVWHNQALFGALCALLIHNYVLGDHLDGMHAKHTGTSSPLGEFLDHFLDIFNGALMVWSGISIMFGTQHPAAMYVMLYFYFLVFASTMMEEKETGYLQFGRYGNLESFMTMILFFLTWTIHLGQKLWQTPLLWGLDARWAYLGISTFGFGFTTLAIRLRLGYWPRPFLMFVLGGLSLTLFLSQSIQSQAVGFMLLALHAGDYIGRVQGAHCLERPHPYPDVLAPLAGAILLPLQLLGLLPSSWGILVATLMVAYLLVRAALGPGEVIFRLREHWRWVN